MKRRTDLFIPERKKVEIKKETFSSSIFDHVKEKDIFTANVTIKYGKKIITRKMILSVHEGEIIQEQHKKELKRVLKTEDYQITKIEFIQKLGVTNRNCGYTIIGIQDEKGKRNIRTGNYE